MLSLSKKLVQHIEQVVFLIITTIILPCTFEANPNSCPLELVRQLVTVPRPYPFAGHHVGPAVAAVETAQVHAVRPLRLHGQRQLMGCVRRLTAAARLTVTAGPMVKGLLYQKGI